MDIRTEASCVIDATVEELFEAFLKMDITRLMTGYGPFPAVVRIEAIDDEWQSVGALRRIHLGDGTSALEELERVEAPHRFTYRVTENDGPLGLMVRAIRGDFRFSKEGTKTRVDWSQTFETKLPFVGLLLPVLKLGWTRYLDAALVRAKTITENQEIT